MTEFLQIQGQLWLVEGLIPINKHHRLYMNTLVKFTAWYKERRWGEREIFQEIWGVAQREHLFEVMGSDRIYTSFV